MRPLGLVLVAAVLLAACAGGGGDVAEPLTVPEARSAGDGEVTVTGSLVVTDDEVRLCEVLLESYPPQCGGEALRVEGLDVDALPLVVEGDVAWSEGGTMLQGVLDGDVLRDAELVEGAVT